jgi:hypothetical protein
MEFSFTPSGGELAPGAVQEVTMLCKVRLARCRSCMIAMRMSVLACLLGVCARMRCVTRYGVGWVRGVEGGGGVGAAAAASVCVGLCVCVCVSS